MPSDRGTAAQQPRDVTRADGLSATCDYLCLGGPIYRLSSHSKGLVADRWDVRLNTWAPFDLAVLPPVHQPNSGVPQVGDDSAQSSPFAYHQGPSDVPPVLYTSALASSDTPLACIGADGRFHGQTRRDAQPGPLGPLLSLGDCLLAAERDRPRLWASAEPLKGDWKPLGDPSWEAREQMRISHLTRYQDRLQVFLDNPDAGFEIWQSDDRGASWSLVVPCGAYRYRRNALISALAITQGYTFIAASSINGDPFDCGRSVGFEILVLTPSAHWDVLSGECRCTPAGLRAPLLARGPGLDRINDHRVIGLGCTQDGLFVLTGRRRLWRLTESEVERLAIDEDLTPTALLASDGTIRLVLGSDALMGLQRLS